MESEVLVKSLGLNCFSLVKINNLPFLVSAIVLVPGDNLSTFLILS
jgi:hypothetical protein